MVNNSQEGIAEEQIKKAESALKERKFPFRTVAIIAAAAIVIILAFFVYNSLNKQPQIYPKNSSIEGYINILEKNKDYKEYVSSFKDQFKREPTFLLTEDTLLNNTYIERKIAELKNSAMDAYALVYENLPASDSLHLIQLQEQGETNRGLITVIDTQTKEVVKIYAALNILLKGG